MKLGLNSIEIHSQMSSNVVFYSERKRIYILESREKRKEVQDRHKVSGWSHVIEMLVTRKYTLNCAICVFGLLDLKIKRIPYLDTNNI